MPRAERDIWEAYRYLFDRSPEAAVKWYRNVREAIRLLAEMPLRNAQAPEVSGTHEAIRQTHPSSNAKVYRIIYLVIEESSQVHVLTVRHGARAPLTATMIDELLREIDSL